MLDHQWLDHTLRSELNRSQNIPSYSQASFLPLVLIFFFLFMPLVYIRLEIEKENVKCPMEGVQCSLRETSFFLHQGKDRSFFLTSSS